MPVAPVRSTWMAAVPPSLTLKPLEWNCTFEAGGGGPSLVIEKRPSELPLVELKSSTPMMKPLEGNMVAWKPTSSASPEKSPERNPCESSETSAERPVSSRPNESKSND